jgi:hypothetical protein
MKNEGNKSSLSPYRINLLPNKEKSTAQGSAF